MRFVVHAKDKPDAAAGRMSALQAHREHLDTMPHSFDVQVLLSGPLTDDEGKKMIGSFFLLEAADRRNIEALFEKDPLMLAEVWEDMRIDAVLIRQDNLSQMG